MNASASGTRLSPSFNPFHRFIRVVNVQARGMVEFEFALGEPEMFVEMIMPMPVFEEFCRAQGLDPRASLAAAASGAKRLSFMQSLPR